MTERSIENERRFDDLFAAHGPDIVAYCGWRASSASDAQDVVADVFLTAWRRLDDVPDDPTAARVWLYATARRMLANQRRSNRRRQALHDRLAVEAVSTAPARRSTDEESLVHAALDLLGARDREVLLLSEWEGLSPTEIASVLGCRTVTARGRLHRARRRFRAAFEDVRDGDRRAAAAPRPGTPDYSLLREGGS